MNLIYGNFSLTLMLKLSVLTKAGSFMFVHRFIYVSYILRLHFHRHVNRKNRSERTQMAN